MDRDRLCVAPREMGKSAPDEPIHVENCSMRGKNHETHRTLDELGTIQISTPKNALCYDEILRSSKRMDSQRSLGFNYVYPYKIEGVVKNIVILPPKKNALVYKALCGEASRRL